MKKSGTSGRRRRSSESRITSDTMEGACPQGRTGGLNLHRREGALRETSSRRKSRNMPEEQG